MTDPWRRARQAGAVLIATFAVFSSPADALDELRFDVSNGDEDLSSSVQSASLLSAAQRDGRTTAQDILAAAGADYSTILGALYARGHYGGVIRILIDGREASQIAPLDPPANVSRVVVQIDPGPAFRFGTARIAPLAPGTRLPAGFARGQVAGSDVAGGAVDVAAKQWRKDARAKVRVSDQSFVADHTNHTLSADITLDPGPRVSFGNLIPASGSAVRDARLIEIAGLQAGRPFHPDTLDRVAERLRRTGTFRSVNVSDAAALRDGNTLDIGVEVVDEKPRRIGFGGEIATQDGVSVSGFWMHRNLLGGAERLRIEGEITGIEGNSGGTDYKLGARFDRPATFGADTSLYLLGEVERQDEPNYQLRGGKIEIGATRFVSKGIEGEFGFGLNYAKVDDSFGRRQFTYLTMPTKATWDYRDDRLNPTRGLYVNLDGLPFIGIGGSASGAKIALEGRAYRKLDPDGRFIAAARLKFGTILGSDIADTPPDLLFYSGGGGTVRGHPYKSLGVDLGGGNMAGGRAFIGLSVELRAKLKGKLSIAGFADAGYIGSESLYDGSGNWHSGAGLGLRYETGLGPIRFDAAMPVSGKTASGAQFYVGIGQSF